MGCNFYTLSGKHIGKRSAAGYYCWDCDITLCKQGNDGVHKGETGEAGQTGWFKKCPLCGQMPQEESLDDSSAGRELGFNKQPFGKKMGVKSCSSFSWAMEKAQLKRIIFVKDEYGRKYTKRKFWKMLDECPIQYFDSIGTEFS